ncbi:hypothetical protein Cus16_1412 [Curtobacterium sp. ER1/6]|nr:hypothetical protein Cus16_1412 [Curtobacterium sp. ER1/6]
MAGVVALLALGTATGAVALTLTQQDRPVAAPVQTQEPAPAPSATIPSSAPITATPAPRPTSLPTAPAGTVVPIPAPCSSLVPEGDYARFFGAARLIETVFEDGDPRETTPEDRLHGLTSPDGNLSCWWRNEGTAAELSINIHRTSADEEVVAAEGTCSDRLGGRVCTTTITHELSTAPQTATTLYRDGLTVSIGQTDFPTNGLLPAVVGEIWGD